MQLPVDEQLFDGFTNVSLLECEIASEPGDELVTASRWRGLWNTYVCSSCCLTDFLVTVIKSELARMILIW